MAAIVKEIEETEKDADSLKTIMVSLLERVTEIISINRDDIDELKKFMLEYLGTDQYSL